MHIQTGSMPKVSHGCAPSTAMPTPNHSPTLPKHGAVTLPRYAINLKRLATGACAAQSALPVASLAATPGTAAGMGSAGDGKVTPARHEHGRTDGSGQEQNDAHFRAHF